VQSKNKHIERFRGFPENKKRNMASEKQKEPARKNIKKAAAAAKKKQTLKKLPKSTRIALGKEGAKARQKKEA
jgi:hypothetical protein